MRQWIVLVLVISPAAVADEFKINGHQFTVPSGFEVEQVAGPPLVMRPISADFDEQGRLYVTDSSGSNEPVAVQQKKRPHRIVRLEDTNGDGRYDKSIVFADKLMFPEGSMWFDGSLYVAAPPEIWKFTDTNDDGIADKREVWFDGKTLTHCANDLHGPYLGPDGWMYWCKGAFADQTHQLANGKTLKTRAAHIFRRRPGGGLLDVVMTGGMDNPVEIAFSPGGERFFTTTFLVHPNQGKRDGVIHAVYGGVYGKDHGAISGHVRTGDLMPNLSHLGAAAPCGLTRLETDGLGKGYKNSVLASLFNMHKVTRHVLTRDGAGFLSDTSDLLVSDNLDFHPTDVLEDADGSLLVVDTGGWFRLCCPTSQLEKPDVLGGIYRLRCKGAESIDDPRGLKLKWNEFAATQLTELLRDGRFAVRERAKRQLVKNGAGSVESLSSLLKDTNPEVRLQAVWGLAGIDHPSARAAIRTGLADRDETVLHAVLHSISLYRDVDAVDDLIPLLNSAPSHIKRIAAEALGRIGSKESLPALLNAVPAAMKKRNGPEAVDRFLEHSLIYAAIEVGSPDTLRRYTQTTQSRTRRAALIALDQLDGGKHIRPKDIRELLVSPDPVLNDAAWWIAEKRTDWGSEVAGALEKELSRLPSTKVNLQRLTSRLTRFAGNKDVQTGIAEALRKNLARNTRIALLNVMRDSGQKHVPSVWQDSLMKGLSDDSGVMLESLVVLNKIGKGKLSAGVAKRVNQLAAKETLDAETRLRALNLIPVGKRSLIPGTLGFVCKQLSATSAISHRTLALDFLSSTPLTSAQLIEVASHIPTVGALELRSVLNVFQKSTERPVGSAIVANLNKSAAAASLLPAQLEPVFAKFDSEVKASAKPLFDRIEKENRAKLERMKSVLELLPKADMRRGLKVFQSTKASCIACHRRGYIGGSIGPDLNRIGTIRKERDLLEAILFPSMSFVRSFEPVTIATDEGKVFNGTIRDETKETLTLQLDAQKTVTIQKDSIENRKIGTVSIMPAGLEKQLSPQDLADLIKYLKEG